MEIVETVEWMNCHRCRRKILRTVHNKMYCDPCKQIIQNERQMKRYHAFDFICKCVDCGEAFHAKKSTTLRCPDCRRERRLKREAKKQAKAKKEGPVPDFLVDGWEPSEIRFQKRAVLMPLTQKRFTVLNRLLNGDSPMRREESVRKRGGHY